jgi:thiosulfate/3-mercaptopyruvate sulfurtransferase
MRAPIDCLVETGWLAAHLDAPDIVVLEATMHLPGAGRDAVKEYQEVHIPGALFFDVDEISDTASPLPHMLPSPAKFSARVRKMGIGDGTRVVIYDRTNMSGAARAWWMFRVMGASDVAVLNGGFEKWRSEDHRLETLPARPRTERHLTARLNSSLVRDIDDMRAMIRNGDVQIVDARSSGRFAGVEPEPREVPRLGHIPGAKNVPFTDLLARDGTLCSPEKIRTAFTRQGVDPSKPVVTSCGSGVTACLLALGLARLGNEMVAVYDGSWAEWSAADTPVEGATMPPNAASG